MSRLLILAPSGPDSQDLVNAAGRLGHDVFSASHVTKHSPGDKMDGIADDFVIDFSSSGAVSQIVDHAVDRRINGIVTTNEFLTPLVTRACAALSLPGNLVEFATAPRSKVGMANRFERCGVAMPRTFVVESEDDLHEIIRKQQLSFPLVVKPAENAGSKGVSIVSAKNELPAAFARVQFQEGTYDIPLDKRVIVQEYVDGDEYSVESVTQNGRTRHICVTRKITTAGAFRVEIGHSVPARLEDALDERILGEVSKAIRAVGILNSISHTEVKVRPDGSCAVIEVASRIGAGRIGTLVDLALGINLPEATVNVALGVPMSVEPLRSSYATIRLFLCPAGGRLVAVKNMPEVGDDVPIVTLSREIGSIVSGPESNKGRIGHFIVTGTDERAVNRRADELSSRVEITVEPTVADAGHRT